MDDNGGSMEICQWYLDQWVARPLSHCTRVLDTVTNIIIKENLSNDGKNLLGRASILSRLARICYGCAGVPTNQCRCLIQDFNAISEPL